MVYIKIIKAGVSMNPYLKVSLIAIAIIAASVISYYLIVGGHPYEEDLTESYFNTILILKGNITIGAILSISISSAIVLRK